MFGERRPPLLGPQDLLNDVGERARIEGVRKVEATFLLAAVDDDDNVASEGSPDISLGFTSETSCRAVGFSEIAPQGQSEFSL